LSPIGFLVIASFFTRARPAVTGKLVSVLKDELDWNRLPQKAQRLLRRCLEKDPRRRLRDIADAMALIDDVPQGTALRHSKPPWVVAGTLALALAVSFYYFTRPAPLRPLVRLNAEIAADTPLARIAAGGVLALSPDGARLALTLRGADGENRLYTRLLHQNQVTPLAGTENAFSPFFSPDGEWIGFFADGKLKKISVEGGAAVTLCDAPDPDGASWGDDSNIVASLNGVSGSGLWRVPSSGESCVPVTKLNSGEVPHRWPQVLPGSQAVLFTASTHVGNYDDANIDVVSLKTGERKTVQRGRLFPPLPIYFQRNRTSDLPAPEHAFRRALRSQPAGTGRSAGADSGRCQRQRRSGRGFCIRRRAPWARDFRVPRREGTGSFSDLLAGQRG